MERNSHCIVAFDCRGQHLFVTERVGAGEETLDARPVAKGRLPGGLYPAGHERLGIRLKVGELTNWQADVKFLGFYGAHAIFVR